MNNQERTMLFVYGTLKQGFPNHPLLSELFIAGDATLLSPSAATAAAFPLVVGPLAIPFLPPLPSAAGSHRVSGELISVSPHALAVLDAFEGTALGHYERRPVTVTVTAGGDGGEAREIAAEAYFAHRSYAAEMWRRTGQKGVAEYSKEMAMEYVKPGDRPRGIGSLR